MGETLNGLGTFLKLTGGLGILILYPLFPVLIIYLVYEAMKVGRGYWSAGTNKQRREAAEKILADPDASPLKRYVAQTMLSQE